LERCYWKYKGSFSEKLPSRQVKNLVTVDECMLV